MGGRTGILLSVLGGGGLQVIRTGTNEVFPITRGTAWKFFTVISHIPPFFFFLGKLQQSVEFRAAAIPAEELL